MKFKVAVAGCSNACSQPQIKDFGLNGQTKSIATENRCTECKKGIRITMNGKLGRHPKLADIIAELAEKDEVYRLLENMVLVLEKMSR